MSKLRRADYTAPLKGKTIERVHGNNEQDENHLCLSVLFTDHTFVSFRFHVSLDEEVELADYDGNLSNERELIPLTIPIKP
jgi:hypothetical protein